jgi:hypothetical protein
MANNGERMTFRAFERTGPPAPFVQSDFFNSSRRVPKITVLQSGTIGYGHADKKTQIWQGAPHS